MAETTFTHIGVKKETRRKIAVLAKAQNVDIYKLAEYLVNQDWERAVAAGMVTNAMIEQQAHWVKAEA